METNTPRQTPLNELIDWIRTNKLLVNNQARATLTMVESKALSLLAEEQSEFEKAWETGRDRPHEFAYPSEWFQSTYKQTQK